MNVAASPIGLRHNQDRNLTSLRLTPAGTHWNEGPTLYKNTTHLYQLPHTYHEPSVNL